MSTYRYTTGLDYTFAQMTEMFNLSFERYFVPMTMTPESIAAFYRVYQGAPEYCVVMHTEDGNFVGLARLALRGSRAWCGGFGIAPAFRGKGIGKLLVDQMIQAAQKAGATTLRDIAAALNARGVATARGGQWHAKSVSNILERA